MITVKKIKHAKDGLEIVLKTARMNKEEFYTYMCAKVDERIKFREYEQQVAKTKNIVKKDTKEK